MKKILFILSDQAYVRNYFHTKVIEKLKDNYNLEILKRDNINEKETKNILFKNYKLDTQSKIKTIIFDLYANHFQEKSKYFSFRLKRFYRFDFRYLGELCIHNNEKDSFFNKYKRLYILLKNFIIFSILNFMSLKFIFFFVLKFFEKKININKSFRDLVLNSKCDYILMPTNGYSPEVFDLLKMSKLYGLKVNFIIDNWDNLSSKMIFFEEPHKIFVWGEQTLIHAMEIHKIPKEKIIKIGSARYLDFFKKRKDELKNYFDFKYILFLGSSWAWDEEATLDELAKILEKNKNIFNNIKIIYRYHPFRQRKNRETLKWKNIIVDPQLSNLKNQSERSWPKIDYYPALLKNCEFAIGGFTTMLLEATIFYKRFVGIGYDDNKSLMNQKNALKYFEHLKDIEKMNNLSICHKKENLEKILIETMLNSNNLNHKLIDEQREYFLSYNSNKPYEQILIESLAS